MIMTKRFQNTSSCPVCGEETPSIYLSIHGYCQGCNSTGRKLEVDAEGNPK